MDFPRLRYTLLTISLLFFITAGQAGPIVRTSRGYISGIQEKGISVFKGIPYAAPPIGALRFKAPVGMPAWQDTLQCNAFGSIATQYDANTVKGDENCLSLNLFTPTLTPAKKMPVLVWIHGGGMTVGTGMRQNGHAFSHADSIITVTINYRLGVFGFLYLGDVPGYQSAGNNGLLDCIMALKWIKENISAFGGDPSRVTVIGESAGAKMASTLLVTPAAKGYFNNLILESGAVQSIRDSITAKAIRQRVMDTLKISNPADLLQLPAETLITAQTKVLGGAKGTNYFGPLEDGKIIKGDALAYIRKHKNKKVRVLLGSNKAESTVFMNMDKRLNQPDSTSLSDWFGDNYHYISDAFQKLAGTQPNDAAMITLSRYMYRMHTWRLAKALAVKGNPVWLFSFEQEKNGAPATHGDELAYVFYEAGSQQKPANPDLAVLIHQQWADFIKGKSPWKRFDQYISMMILDSNSHETTAEGYEDPDHPTMGFILN